LWPADQFAKDVIESINLVTLVQKQGRGVPGSQAPLSKALLELLEDNRRLQELLEKERGRDAIEV
jgi:hypothetical protein